MDNHIRPQYEFIGPTTSIFRYEELPSLFKKLKDEYHVTSFKNFHSTGSNKPDTLNNLGYVFKTLYKDIYFKDHELLKYDTPFNDDF